MSNPVARVIPKRKYGVKKNIQNYPNGETTQKAFTDFTAINQKAGQGPNVYHQTTASSNGGGNQPQTVQRNWAQRYYDYINANKSKVITPIFRR